MSDKEEGVWVIFNGEIYNFKELRSELESCGHRFQTRSDTEVIVHGYKEWGTKVFNRLNGMFGLAIWDVRNRRLVVARDAMGIKMIYYRLSEGQLIFGSEIRSVVAAGGARPEVDPIALNRFLRFRYTPSPLTIFQGDPETCARLYAYRGKWQMPGRALVRLPAKSIFDRPKEEPEAESRTAGIVRGRGRTPSAQRCSRWNTFERGLDSGLLLSADESSMAKNGPHIQWATERHLKTMNWLMPPRRPLFWVHVIFR